MKAEAVYVISNTMTVNIYRLEYGIEDRVLAGETYEKAEWCEVQYCTETSEAYFTLGEMEILLGECMRVDD